MKKKSKKPKKSARSQKFILILLIVAFAFAVSILSEHSYEFYREKAHPQSFSDCVSQSSAEFGVPEPIIYSTIKTESNFDPDALSPAGAVGLMQLMPETFSWITNDMLFEKLPDSMISDPKTNIRYGTYMLAWLYARYGEWDLVFAAYNAGVGNVDKWLADERYSSDGKLTSIPFSETRAYVERQHKNIEIYEKLYY